MKTAITVALAMTTPAAAATGCSPGYTHKEDLTNAYCTDSNTNAASCNSGCCDQDKTTCGGVAMACSFGTYAANDDAWKSTKTTAYDAKTKKKDQAKFQTECCKPVSTCSSTLYTCPAGMKPKQNSAVKGIKCPGGPESCATAMCCESDVSTCGGYYDKNKVGFSAFCGVGQFPKTNTDAVLTDDTWKVIKNTGNAALTPVTFKNVCCAEAATCASKGYTCPAGKKRDNTAATKAKECDAKTVNGKKEYNDGACATSTTAACCINDVDTCGRTDAATSCTSNRYAPTDDSWKAKKFVGTQSSACCAEKATCKVAKCPAGWKKRKNVDLLSCPNDKASCAGSTCCELDTNTCGGLENSISCPYGFYNEATYFVEGTTPQSTLDAWRNRAATQKTKDTACCTPRQMCVNGLTTTPSPVAATTTPVAPARLYTAHKAASKAQNDGASIVWLGAGVVLGMAVLMGIQRVRSRSSIEEPVE